MSFIKAENLVVEFPIFGNDANRSVKNLVLNATTGGRFSKSSGKKMQVRALDDLTFTVSPGDRVGLVGHNGSGKTTLLRALVGAYEPSYGSLQLDGKIASLLDIQIGMNEHATGYENIYLRGVMMGLSPEEIRSKTQEIAEFTELGEYLNMPIRTYSSGMRLRLSFAVSTCADADIIIMDEWLSVGDSAFQDKAARRLEKAIENAAILVIATHAPELVERVCNRRFTMEHGRIIEDIRIKGPDTEDGPDQLLANSQG